MPPFSSSSQEKEKKRGKLGRRNSVVGVLCLAGLGVVVKMSFEILKPRVGSSVR